MPNKAHTLTLDYDGASEFTAKLVLHQDVPQAHNFPETVVMLSSVLAPGAGPGLAEQAMDGPSSGQHNQFTFKYYYPNAPVGLYKAVATLFSRNSTHTMVATRTV